MTHTRTYNVNNNQRISNVHLQQSSHFSLKTFSTLKKKRKKSKFMSMSCGPLSNTNQLYKLSITFCLKQNQEVYSINSVNFEQELSKQIKCCYHNQPVSLMVPFTDSKYLRTHSNDWSRASLIPCGPPESWGWWHSLLVHSSKLPPLLSSPRPEKENSPEGQLPYFEARVCVCVCVCACVCAWMCVCVCVHAGMYACMHVCMCVCTGMYPSVCIYMCVCTCLHMCV